MVKQTQRLAPMVMFCCLGIAGSFELARSAVASEPAENRSEVEFFERRVRPLLVQRCGACHVEGEAGGLSLASREGLLRGGDSGTVVAPGDPASSRLVAAVRREAAAPMPPDQPLAEDEVRILERWIERGAHWPAEVPQSDTRENAAEHWAFQPIDEPAIPEVARSNWPRNAIDPFVLRRLDSAGLSPSPEADRRTLIRRVTYALTGLPPTSEEVEAFVRSSGPNAYEELVERLLQSPQYGQHQARMWLDLARYSDTKGYVYAREQRFWVHAWNYRDWVVRSLNRDMPYDRFLLLQIAADQVPNRNAGDLAAMGFLTLGRRFLGVKHDIIDDRIDVVCRGTMALTVGCARCHDHKYDPIPTEDYYSLYGVFDSCSEQLVPLPGAEDLFHDPDSEIRSKFERFDQELQKSRRKQAARVRESIGEYLWAQTELHKYPGDGFGQIFAEDDLLPAFVRRFEDYLGKAEHRQDAVFSAWRAYRSIPRDEFAEEAPQVTVSLRAGDYGRVNPYVLEAFQRPPESFRQVVDRYAEVFHEIDRRWRASGEPDAASGGERPALLSDPDAQQLRKVLYGTDSPCVVPDQDLVDIEVFFASDTTTRLWNLRSELDQAILQAGESAPFALTLVDNDRPVPSRVFRRGNPLDEGRPVTRHFLTALAGDEPSPFQRGSGRLELARRIIDPQNPLTGRVIVNRIWAHHFGTGLVPTTSDFGRRAEPPSHPELLDFLTRRFIAENWSLKNLHRRIVLSASYRQSSLGLADPDARAKATEIDPENRLLWRMNPHRLTFEELRDSILAASGTLDMRLGGKPGPILKSPPSHRRTLYGLVDRQFLPSTFRVFDFASPDLHIPRRSETTTPQQSLFLMNHPFVVDQAARLVSDLEPERDLDAAIDSVFERVLRREPTLRQREEARALILSAAESTDSQRPRPPAQDWRYGYAALDQSSGRMLGFTALPHFSGDAWQGSEQYPDAALGWVKLTATGGHPGNDRQHASVRRWVAPHAMTIRIQSQLEHEPAAGDGVRAFIVSSRRGILQSAEVHQQSAALEVQELKVTAGETIDFVVDINRVLNSDQYLWTAEIESLDTPADAAPLRWNSADDFSRSRARRLSPLAQLAQLLFCTSEFTFVD